MGISIDLDGRVILVCGVARGGIGGTSARRLAEAGAQIVAVDHIQGAVDETVGDIEARGGRCHGITVDLVDAGQCATIFDTIARTYDRLDGLVNVAGGTKPHQWGALAETPSQVAVEVLQLNFDYVFRICRDAAAFMIARNLPGSFVNIGSVSAHLSAPRHGLYAAAKSATIALTRTMSTEWKSQGIRVNTVSPGPVASARILAGRSASDSEFSTADFASVDAVANAVLFLISDLASGISGRDLVVDNGLSAGFWAGGR